MKLDARQIARRVLLRVGRDQAFANLVLSAELHRARHLDGAERGLATELTYGVLRHQRQLDHALGQHAARPLQQLDPESLVSLRVAAYQLLLLDRIPAYAAVNDAVEAIRRARGPRVAGFANAVLRRVDRADLTRSLPEDEVQRLAVECSLPDPLARRLCDQLGLAEARALGMEILGRAPLTARVNTLRTSTPELEGQLTGQGARVEPGRWSADALHVQGLPEPFVSSSYLDGLWTAQDEAAQLVSQVLGPRPGETVLDACAGVGGKSTHLAALMGNEGRVHSVDPSARKLELLREHCLRLGVTCCETREADLRQLAPAGSPVERVLVDAPCSGLGVLRRHPELKWRLSLEAIPQLVLLQRELLGAAARWLAPGGVLVYAVCTITEEEGPEQARWLLAEHPELVLDDDAEPLRRIGEGAMIRLWPHRHRTDGFFVARFRRAR